MAKSEEATVNVAEELRSPQQQQLPVQQVQREFLAKLRAVDVSSSALPLLLVAKLFGLVTCRVVSRVTTSRPGAVYSRVTLAKSRLGAVYSLVIVAALGYVDALLIPMLRTHTNSLYDFDLYCKMQLGFILAFSCILNGLRQKKLVSYFEKVADIDVSMADMNICVPHARNQVFAFVMTVFVTSLRFLFFNILNFVNVSSDIRLSYSFPDIVVYVFECCFVFCVLALRQRFRLLNDHLQGRPVDVRTTSLIHATLCDAAALLNDVYSSTLFFMFAFYFAEAIVSTFYVMDLFETGSPLLGVFLCQGVINTARASIICWACDEAVKESVSTRDELNAVMLKTSDTEAKEEMKSFWLILISKKIRFSAGLFSVDLDLFYSMFGAAMTYFIIMNQLV